MLVKVILFWLLNLVFEVIVSVVCVQSGWQHGCHTLTAQLFTCASRLVLETTVLYCSWPAATSSTPSIGNMAMLGHSTWSSRSQTPWQNRRMSTVGFIIHRNRRWNMEGHSSCPNRISRWRSNWFTVHWEVPDHSGTQCRSDNRLHPWIFNIQGSICWKDGPTSVHQQTDGA